jgi:chromosome segregation ATPase
MEAILKQILGKVDGIERSIIRLEGRVSNLEQGQAKLEQGQARLEEGFFRLEGRVDSLEQGQAKLEQGQQYIIRKLDAVIEQTADLLEWRTQVNSKLDDLTEKQDNLYNNVEHLAGELAKQKMDIEWLKKKIV